jgi:hypothetical protein
VANLGCAHNVLIGPNGCVAALEHAELPGKELKRGNTSSPCQGGNAHARLHGFLYQPHLLSHGPASAALHGSDDFDPSKRLVGTLGLEALLIGACLWLIGYAACPIRMGCAPLISERIRNIPIASIVWNCKLGCRYDVN